MITTATTVRTLDSLLGNEGQAYAAAGHVLVTDGATGAIYTADEAASLAESWQENIDRAEAIESGEERDYALGQAYSLACAATSAMHEDQVSEEVRQALREESGLDRLTWGW